VRGRCASKSALLTRAVRRRATMSSTRTLRVSLRRDRADLRRVRRSTIATTERRTRRKVAAPLLDLVMTDASLQGTNIIAVGATPRDKRRHGRRRDDALRGEANLSARSSRQQHSVSNFTGANTDSLKSSSSPFSSAIRVHSTRVPAIRSGRLVGMPKVDAEADLSGNDVARVWRDESMPTVPQA